MFLVVGHPRCGTKFTSSLLKQFDLDVGHEELGKNGISAWFFTCLDDIDIPFVRHNFSMSRNDMPKTSFCYSLSS